MAENVMKQIKVDKLTLNIGAGKDQRMLEKGLKLIKQLTGLDGVKTVTQKRIASWGIRPGLPVGCKITLRGQDALDLIKRLVEGKSYNLKLSSVDNNGNISFGVEECIDIPGTKYDPEIGIIGFECSITLARPGFRVKNRRLRSAKIPTSHRINKEEAMEFFKSNFNVKFVDGRREE
jgi:large subunit ribosomal protein L5